MSVLNINLADLESVKTGLTILQAIVDGGGKLAASALNVVENVTGCDINNDGLIGGTEAVVDSPLGDIMGGDPLGDIFPEAEKAPAGPSLEGVKEAITAMAVAKGRDAAKNLVQGILKKLSAKSIEEIPTDKFGAVIDILKKSAA